MAARAFKSPSLHEASMWLAWIGERQMVSQAMIRAERDAAYAGNEYAWVITRDRDHELDPCGKSAVGVCGPHGATDAMIELAKAKGVPFRLLDEGDIDDCGDTGVVPGDLEYGVVYEGVIWFADPDGGQDFAPLDDYGTPNYGCTSIEYMVDGVWTTC